MARIETSSTQSPERRDKVSPSHVMIIPGVNEVWHEPSSEFAILSALSSAQDTGTHFVTFKLPPTESIVDFPYLPELIEDLLPQLQKTGVRLRHYGPMQKTPRQFLDALNHAECSTISNDSQTMTFAFGSGRDELLQSSRTVMRVAQSNDPNGIDENAIREHLFIPDMPDVDMMLFMGVDTEKPFLRLPGNFLFQSAYAELVAVKSPFADLRNDGVYDRALNAFHRRVRKYGGLLTQKE